MYTTLVLMCLLSGNPKINPGDPVLNVTIMAKSGGKFELPDIVNSEDTFFFILSANCPYCVDAIQTINDKFGDMEVLIAFVGEWAEIVEFTNKNPGLYQAFKIEESELKKYSINILPFMTCFRDKKVILGYHGQFSEERGVMLVKIIYGD